MLTVAGVVETVLEVLRGTDPASPLVLDLEREVAKHPHKFRHVLMQALLVVPLAQFSIGPDGPAEGSHHFQLAEGAFVDGSD